MYIQREREREREREGEIVGVAWLVLVIDTTKLPYLL